MKFAPYPLTLRQLQYVLAVSEELSFRRAAARCRVSQPSLSTQIAQLEELLGVKLFERTRRQVLVSAVGKEIVETARRVFMEVEALLESGRLGTDPLAGTLSLGVIPTVSPYLLPSVTPNLRAMFPRLTIAWREDKTDPLLKRLEEGGLDGALVALEAEIGDVERAVIATDPFVLATRRNHPLAVKKETVTAADLRDEELLLLEDGHCFRNQTLEVCATARAREGEFRATSLSTLVQMVAGGAGITMLPKLAVATETKRGRLHVRAIDLASAHRTIALIWRKRSPRASTLRAIAAAIREAYPISAQKKERSR